MYKFFNSIYNRIKGAGRMKKAYTIIVHKEDNVYWAECPELEGCFAQANSIEELKKLMTNSIYLYSNNHIDAESTKVKEKNEIKLELSYA